MASGMGSTYARHSRKLRGGWSPPVLASSRGRSSWRLQARRTAGLAARRRWPPLTPSTATASPPATRDGSDARRRPARGTALRPTVMQKDARPRARKWHRDRPFPAPHPRMRHVPDRAGARRGNRLPHDRGARHRRAQRLVTPRCRIYHNASQKWLPIEFHPHYKQALSLPAARVAEAVRHARRASPAFETLSFAVAPAARPRRHRSRAGARRRARRRMPAAQALTDAAPSQERRSTKRRRSTSGRASGRAADSARGSSATAQPSGAPARAHALEAQASAAHETRPDVRRGGSGREPAGHEAAAAEARGHAGLAATHRSRDHGADLPPRSSATHHPVTAAGHGLRTQYQPTPPALSIRRGACGRRPLRRPTSRHPPEPHSPSGNGARGEHRSRGCPRHGWRGSRAAVGPTPARRSPSRLPARFVSAAVGARHRRRSVRRDRTEPAMAPLVHDRAGESWPVMPAVQPAPELPKISYPEFTPAEEPVPERASRRAATARCRWPWRCWCWRPAATWRGRSTRRCAAPHVDGSDDARGHGGRPARRFREDGPAPRAHAP